jgi:hypothetical protein
MPQQATQTDWFSQNAPKAPPPGASDWFAANAPTGARPTEAAQAAELVPRTLAQSQAVSQRVPIAGAERGGVFRAESGAYTPTEQERPLPLPPPTVQPPPPTTFAGRAANEAGNIWRGMTAPPDTAFGSPVNPIGAAQEVAGAAKERGKEFMEHPAAAAGATVTDIAAAAAPFALHAGASALEENVLEPRRQVSGTAKAKMGLGIPAPPEASELSGRGSPEPIKAASDFDIAKKDLAAIERGTPVTAKGSQGTFIRAKNMVDYAHQLWEDGHKAPISRNVNMPTNPSTLAQAGQSVLTEGLADSDPAGARRSRTWLNNSVNKPRSLGAADQFLRELNADINSPAANEAYGNTFLRVKSAVASATRKEIEDVLTNAGETGVRDVNMRYTAISKMADRAIDQGIAEAKTEAKAGPLPDWIRPYLFAHRGGMSAGLSAHLPGPKPSVQLAEGMTGLARTKLTPPPIETPTPRLPASVGPDTSGPVRPGMGPSAYSWNQSGPAPPPVAPEHATEAVGTMQPVALGPGAGGPIYTGPTRPPTRQSLPALPERSGVSPSAAPATGIVGSTFKELGVTDLVTPRQHATLETMLRGPRWKDMAPDEKVQAIRSILKGERFQ